MKERVSKNLIDEKKSYLFGIVKVNYYLEDRGLDVSAGSYNINYKTSVVITIFGKEVFSHVNRSHSTYFWKIEGKEVDFTQHFKELEEFYKDENRNR